MTTKVTHPENLIKGKRYEFKRRIGEMTCTMTGIFDHLWICGKEIKIVFNCDSGAWNGVLGHLSFNGTLIREI